ncbi:MAG: dTMP kinase [Chloroflexaceae bacterium]|nr:dTMP kinase [Chloroflexaceae bacterium]
MSLFITFEGPEGSGKSTQARLLYQRLQLRGYPVILTREPGGTRIGEMIRRILVDLQNTEMAPTTEILLFSAARAQLVNELIRPYLETGGIVLCDRYADSTYAYQGYGLKRDLEELRAMTRIATGGLLPDLTIYLDLEAEEGLERKILSKQAHESRKAQEEGLGGSRVNEGGSIGSSFIPPPEWNRLDARDLAYHQRVATGFRELMLQDPDRWRKMDAHLPVAQLAQAIEAEIEPFLSRVTPLEPL